tara:strand:+ start:33 stop:314 length:282 start_codon:yes stop_codon:yes gene_type:complete
MFVKGISGNPNGRPKNSLNKTSLVKREIQKLLGNVMLQELSPENIQTLLRKASPSARLRFIEGCLKYILPTITVDSELDEIIVELEQIKDVQT